MDDDDGAGAIEVRVCVGYGHAAVSGPARVTDPDAAGKMAVPDLGGELADRTYFLEQPDAVLLQDCEPRRVVAAVLQALQPFEKERREVALPLANVTENPTHCLPFRSAAARG